MMFCICEREHFLHALPKGGVGAELGVFKGEYSQTILDIVEPEALHLVDAWAWSLQDAIPFADVPDYMAEIDANTVRYMGGPPDQALETCYQDVRQRFADRPEVTIHRGQTHDVVKRFQEPMFDFIYIDANHFYEYVLRDLIEWSATLKPGGVILLNDCFDGMLGRRQHLGVVEAVTQFRKRGDWRILALTASAFSDLAMTNNPGAPYAQKFLHNLVTSEHMMVELPETAVASYQHKYFGLGEGHVRAMPSFVF